MKIEIVLCLSEDGGGASDARPRRTVQLACRRTIDYEYNWSNLENAQTLPLSASLIGVVCCSNSTTKQTLRNELSIVNNIPNMTKPARGIPSPTCANEKRSTKTHHATINSYNDGLFIGSATARTPVIGTVVLMCLSVSKIDDDARFGDLVRTSSATTQYASGRRTAK